MTHYSNVEEKKRQANFFLCYIYIYIYMFIYIYMYIYIHNFKKNFACRFLKINIAEFCQPQSNLDFPTLRQGSRERKNDMEHIDNMTLARI